MKNKLLRLVEIIQEHSPEDLVEAFKSTGQLTLDARLALVSAVITQHQQRSATLWLKAGQQRTVEERRAAAQAELAAFVFAYLSGDAKEYVDSGIEALRTLGRHGEVELVTALARR